MAWDTSVLAIEIGSSRIKLGWFPNGAKTSSGAVLPEPAMVYRVDHRGPSEAVWIEEVDRRLDDLPVSPGTACLVASVHPAAAETLDRRSLARRPWSRITTLAAGDLPLEVRVNEPQRVGIDRLLGALATNRLRDPQRPAIVVDMGTATTVNLIAADGAFEGGAILAGPMTSLAVLHTATASLPLVGPEAFAGPPGAVGKSTEQAMAGGAFWGAVGAVREIAHRMAKGCEVRPDVFLTGGASSQFSSLIGLDDQPARHVPHLVLAGIRLAADHLAAP